MLSLRVLALLPLILSLSILAEEQTKVSVQGNEIYYEGSIRKESNEKLFLLHKNNKGIDTVSIKSIGGEVNKGMDLADFIFENQLNVKVVDYCMSSCANYVFPAGKNKILSNAGLIGFHGGVSMFSSQIESLPETHRELAKKYMANAKQREIDFYKKIDVNREITTLGQAEYYSEIYGDDYFGWYYSVDSLCMLGVKNITIDHPPWVFKQPTGKYKLHEVSVNRTTNKNRCRMDDDK